MLFRKPERAKKDRPNATFSERMITIQTVRTRSSTAVVEERENGTMWTMDPCRNKERNCRDVTKRNEGIATVLFDFLPPSQNSEKGKRNRKVVVGYAEPEFDRRLVQGECRIV